MTDKIEWGGTPGPFEVEAHPFDHDYKTHVVFPSRSGLPGQTIFVAEHNWHEAARGERRISWKEAEYNARAAKEIPAMVQALREANDLLADYAEFVRNVPVSEIERHPYLPALDDAVSDIVAILARIDGSAKA